MSTYRRVWTGLVFLLGGLGAFVALMSIEGAVLFCVATLAAALTAVTHHSLRQGVVTWARKEDLIPYTVVGAAGSVALSGYVELMGPHWIPGALALALLSPAVCSRYGPLIQRLPAVTGSWDVEPESVGRVAVQAEEAPAISSPDPGTAAARAAAAMTTTELCLAWRSSFVALGRLSEGPDTLQRGYLVASRQQYLDELELRDPVGFARWLSDGAGPGSDPRRYLKPVNAPRPPS